MNEKEFLTQKDLLDILPIGKKKIYDLLKRNVIPSVRVGRNYLISRKDLDDWYQRNRGRHI